MGPRPSTPPRLGNTRALTDCADLARICYTSETPIGTHAAREKTRMSPTRRLLPGGLLAVFLLASAVLPGPTHPLDAQSPPPPPPPIQAPPFNDFNITAIEVTQGIQNLANDMPLIAGRWTVVRAYVEDLGGKGADAVTARLTARRLGGGGGPGDIIAVPFDLPPGPLVPSNDAGVIAIPADGTLRLDLDGSFWFRIPGSWHHEPGLLQFSVEVNPELEGGGDLNAITLGQVGVAEANRANNTAKVTVGFHDADPVRIRLVPLHLHPGWTAANPPVLYECDEPQRWPITLESLRFVPAASLAVKCAATALEPFPHEIVPKEVAPYEFDMSDPGQCLLANARLDWLRTQENLGSSWIYSGMIHPTYGGLCNGWSGAASSGTIWVRMSGSLDSDPYPSLGGGRTLAHEVGHRFGSNHVLCKGNEGPPNGSIDPDFPYPFPSCRLTAFDVEGFYGFDVYSTIWDPTSDPAVIDNGTPGVIVPPPTSSLSWDTSGPVGRPPTRTAATSTSSARTPRTSAIKPRSTNPTTSSRTPTSTPMAAATSTSTPR